MESGLPLFLAIGAIAFIITLFFVAKSGREVAFYIIQLSLVGLNGYMAYLPTFKCDYFSWGRNNDDGLYLLIIPLGLLPLIALLSVLKYLILRRSLTSYALKRSLYITLGAPVLAFVVLILVDSNAGFLSACLISLAAGIFMIYELIIIRLIEVNPQG